MPTAPRPSILFATSPGTAPDGSGPAGCIRALHAALRAGDLAEVLGRLAPGLDWEEGRGEPGLPIRRRHPSRGVVARLLAGPLAFPRGGEVVALVAEEAAPFRLEAHLWTLDAEDLVVRFRQVAGPSGAPTRR